MFETDRVIGLTSEDAIAQLKQAGFRNIRIMRPGELFTMELCEGRVNISVDENDTAIKCWLG